MMEWHGGVGVSAVTSWQEGPGVTGSQHQTDKCQDGTKSCFKAFKWSQGNKIVAIKV